MSDVLLRHHPELAPALEGVENAFAPWRKRRLRPRGGERPDGARAAERIAARERRASTRSVVRAERACRACSAAAARRSRRRRGRTSTARRSGCSTGCAAATAAGPGLGPGAHATAALLVLSLDDVRRVLEGSPDPFASDPEAKRDGMVAFQPDALTISRGELWENRRRFTEAVLDTGEPAAPAGRPLRRGRPPRRREALLRAADGGAASSTGSLAPGVPADHAPGRARRRAPATTRSSRSCWPS